MEELLVSIVKGLVEKPDEVKITSSTDEDGLTVFHVNVSAEDMGRVIGKQGRIAKAIRTVMRAAAIRQDVKVKVEID
ncbi:MAG: KH domain-containing protein [Clostridia bacterium]|nr:KH domain-containing protein [Clostridia bacterium]